MPLQGAGAFALASYSMRLHDMFLSESILLPWLMEVGHHVRCHRGTLYLHRNGAFEAYYGVMPAATVARMKDFPTTERNEEALLAAFDVQFQERYHQGLRG